MSAPRETDMHKDMIKVEAPAPGLGDALSGCLKRAAGRMAAPRPSLAARRAPARSRGRQFPGRGQDCPRGRQLGALGLVFAEEELAVVAAEEEGEAVQVCAERVQAVGGVADVGQ
jgi:hypothetical protein